MESLISSNHINRRIVLGMPFDSSLLCAYVSRIWFWRGASSQAVSISANSYKNIPYNYDPTGVDPEHDIPSVIEWSYAQDYEYYDEEGVRHVEYAQKQNGASIDPLVEGGGVGRCIVIGFYSGLTAVSFSGINYTPDVAIGLANSYGSSQKITDASTARDAVVYNAIDLYYQPFYNNRSMVRYQTLTV